MPSGNLGPTCLDPVVLELHLPDLVLAHEDGDDGVEGQREDEHGQAHEGGHADLVVQEQDAQHDLEGRGPAAGNDKHTGLPAR